MLFALALAQDIRADQIRWLAENAPVIRTVDPTDPNDSDLAPIGKAIGNRRIVMIGEQSHADGSSFDARTRIFKYLHKHHGFDTIVTEMNMASMLQLDREIQSGTRLNDVLKSSPYWTLPYYEYELVRYAREHRYGKSPIRFYGHDITYYLHPGLTDELRNYFGGTVKEDPAWNEIKVLNYDRSSFAAYKEKPLTEADVARMRSLVAGLEAKLGPQEDPGNETETLYRQILHTIPTGFNSLVSSLQGRGTLGDAHRDRTMGEILIWLARKLRAGHKIAVFSAHFHQIRSGTSDAPKHMQSFVTMGEVFRRAFDRETYTLLFETLDGKVGPFSGSRDGVPFRREDFPIEPAASPESLAAKFGELPEPFRFLNLKTLPRDSWLRKRTIMRPLGYENHEAVWPNLADGVFFIRTMKSRKEAFGRMPGT